MMFQITPTVEGYRLDAYTDLLGKEGWFQWVPLRMFRSQGDAILYRESKAPHLTDLEIKALANHYDPKTLIGLRTAGRWGVVEKL